MADSSSFLDTILFELDLSAHVISTIKTHLTKEIGVEDVEDLYDVRNKDLPKKGIIIHTLTTSYCHFVKIN